VEAALMLVGSTPRDASGTDFFAIQLGFTPMESFERVRKRARDPSVTLSTKCSLWRINVSTTLGSLRQRTGVA